MPPPGPSWAPSASPSWATPCPKRSKLDAFLACKLLDLDDLETPEKDDCAPPATPPRRTTARPPTPPTRPTTERPADFSLLEKAQATSPVPPRKHLHKVPEGEQAAKGKPQGNPSPPQKAAQAAKGKPKGNPTPPQKAAQAAKGKPKGNPSEQKAAQAAKGGSKGNPSAQKRCRKKNPTGYTSQSFGKLKLTVATAQSYIQYWDCTGCLKFLVAFSGKKFQDHPAAVIDMAVWIGEQGASLTKAMVVARRDSLIST
jgi:hypothetical protein